MASVKPSQIDNLMERATRALEGTRYFEAERMAVKALSMAHRLRDYERLATILLPLQEARRQRWQMALDAGDSVTIIEEPFTEDTPIKSGCYLVQPPLVGADARRFRLKALADDVPVGVVCREPSTQQGLVPLVVIGRVTVRTKVRPPGDQSAPSLEWFVQAQEDLGDAAIEDVDTGLSLEKQVDTLMDQLDAIPEHEKLHQHFAEVCRQAAREAVQAAS